MLNIHFRFLLISSKYLKIIKIPNFNWTHVSLYFAVLVFKVHMVNVPKYMICETCMKRKLEITNKTLALPHMLPCFEVAQKESGSPPERSK